MPRQRATGPRRAARAGITIAVLSRPNLRILLRDRQWHPVRELAVQVRDAIPPEMAARAFIVGDHRGVKDTRSESSQADRRRLDMDTQLLEGTKLLLREALVSMFCDHLVERRSEGTPEYTEYRLSEWFCWSCGQRVSGQPPDAKLCDDCHPVLHELDE